MLSRCPGKKDMFKDLRVRFVFSENIISESFFVSNDLYQRARCVARSRDFIKAIV